MSTSQVAGLAQSARALRPVASPSRVFGVSPLPLRLPSIRCSAQAQHSVESLKLQVQSAYYRCQCSAYSLGQHLCLRMHR